ncbi:hypothetical protein JKA74_11425 [Marivirga sp. S37H4]|uniref:Uncharacterized protein n=1 Tax=Marivirga aurantiaca TaxID=2802615 RepID=A0A934WYS1_9BACT|nr:hypothetical protein [Marivirga aurantiaca]MBK6265649.1 hypothetical protein [Marivirga aurantiaca]
MKKIAPFQNLKDANTILDNGGRFYNILTKADDGEITTAEIGKVAGLFNDKQKMVLYFAMSISALDSSEKKEIEAALSDNLKQAYEKYPLQILKPSEAESKGILSSNAIITGIPKMIESKSDFKGFIMVPVSTGKTMSLIMIPIIDQYDVYHIHDNESSKTFLIAHARGADKLPEKTIRVGGTFKELKLKEGKKEIPTMFLEALYYSDLQL